MKQDRKFLIGCGLILPICVLLAAALLFAR